MTIAIKDRAWLTLAETKTWCGIGDADTSLDDRISRLINTACSRIESYIQAPVLNKSFVEYFDGNNSNVVVPSNFPVQSVSEVKIDFNRDFGSDSLVSTDSYVVRGQPSIFDDGTVGLDVCLRDDSNIAILGRIFSGSAIYSIKMTYVAGRGATAADLPDDLVTAALLLVDFLYIARENREIGIVSKGVMGQNYSRKEVGDSGMPKEIEALLDPYIDHALPNVAMPQKNQHGI